MGLEGARAAGCTTGMLALLLSAAALALGLLLRPPLSCACTLCPLIATAADERPGGEKEGEQEEAEEEGDEDEDEELLPSSSAAAAQQLLRDVRRLGEETLRVCRPEARDALRQVKGVWGAAYLERGPGS